MSVHPRANNSDNTHKIVECPLKTLNYTVKFNTMYLYKKILSIEQKPRLCPYAIKFLFINLIMKYPSLKTCVYTKHVF